jgi:hypothetical protein
VNSGRGRDWSWILLVVVVLAIGALAFFVGPSIVGG